MSDHDQHLLRRRKPFIDSCLPSADSLDVDIVPTFMRDEATPISAEADLAEQFCPSTTLRSLASERKDHAANRPLVAFLD